MSRVIAQLKVYKKQTYRYLDAPRHYTIRHDHLNSNRYPAFRTVPVDPFQTMLAVILKKYISISTGLLYAIGEILTTDVTTITQRSSVNKFTP